MQLTVYDFLYSDVDPVWQKIEVCKKTKRHISEMVFMCIKMYLIYMKFVVEDMHEPFKTKRSCYEKVTQYNRAIFQ